jgi:hypothetical protein
LESRNYNYPLEPEAKNTHTNCNSTRTPPWKWNTAIILVLLPMHVVTEGVLVLISIPGFKRQLMFQDVTAKYCIYVKEP